MAPLSRTPLYGVQTRLGARFGDVEGWELPLAYAGARAEHAAARRGTAFFDRSHQGRLRLTGRKRLDLLHRLSTQDLRALAPGQGARAAMLTDKGRLIDDLRVYVLDDHVLLVTSPGRAAALQRHIESLRFRDDVTVEEVTEATAMLLLAGPGAARLLAGATGDAALASALSGMPRHHHRALMAAGAAVTAARASGLHDEAFRLIVAAGNAVAVWDALAEAGPLHGATPAGEEAHEALRIERGVPRAGREITEEHNPLEARLDDAISWTKGCYIGQEVVARLDSRHKVSRLLCGLLLPEGTAGAARPGDTLEAPGRPGVSAGRVTSVAAPQVSGRALALAYVRQNLSSPGTVLTLAADGRGVPATVCDLPFPEP
jgi:folate-binding protein YgfZ